MRTNASRSPHRQPEAVEPHEDQKQTQPKERKQCHDRGLRKNTDRTRDRSPNMQTRNTTEPRSPEAHQLHEGKPTSTRQRTRVTTTAAKLRREDNWDKPQPPQASSQHWKREGRTQSKAQERAGAWTNQRPEIGVA